MHAGYHCGPGIDVGREKAGAPYQRINERALACLDPSDHSDFAGVTLTISHQLVQRGDGIIVEHRPKLGCQPESGRRNLRQLPAKDILNVLHRILTIGAGIPRTFIRSRLNKAVHVKYPCY
jgi:hypothetical protein